MNKYIIYLIIFFAIAFNLTYTIPYINSLNLQRSEFNELKLFDRDFLTYRGQNACFMTNAEYFDVYVNDVFAGKNLDCVDIDYGNSTISAKSNNKTIQFIVEKKDAVPPKADSYLEVSYNGSLLIYLRNGLNKGVVSFAELKLDNKTFRNVPVKLKPNESLHIEENVPYFCGEKEIQVSYQGLNNTIDINKECENTSIFFGFALLLLPLCLIFGRNIYYFSAGFVSLLVLISLISNFFGNIFYASIILLIILLVIALER